jgi:hypothetical protein
MRHGRFSIDKHDQDFQLVDHDRGTTTIFSRAEARFFFVWLMHRLNVQKATLADGREITAMKYFEEVKRFLEKETNEPDKNS